MVSLYLSVCLGRKHNTDTRWCGHRTVGELGPWGSKFKWCSDGQAQPGQDLQYCQGHVQHRVWVPHKSSSLSPHQSSVICLSNTINIFWHFITRDRNRQLGNFERSTLVMNFNLVQVRILSSDWDRDWGWEMVMERYPQSKEMTV